MSIAAITTVFDRAPATWASGQRLVALALADKVNEHGTAWPKLNTLAAMTGLSARNVSRHLAALEAEGWITRETRTGDTGRQTSNLYRWTAPALTLPDTSGMTPTSPLTPVTGTTPTTGRDDTGDRGPMTPVTSPGMTPASSLEPSEEPPPSADTDPSLTNARHSTAREAAIDEISPLGCTSHPHGHRNCAACGRKSARLAADLRARAPAAAIA